MAELSLGNGDCGIPFFQAPCCSSGKSKDAVWCVFCIEILFSE